MIQAGAARLHAARPDPLRRHRGENSERQGVVRIDLKKLVRLRIARPVERFLTVDAEGLEVVLDTRAKGLAAARPMRGGLLQFFTRAPVLISAIAVLTPRRMLMPSWLRAAASRLSRLNSIGDLFSSNTPFQSVITRRMLSTERSFQALAVSSEPSTSSPALAWAASDSLSSSLRRLKVPVNSYFLILPPSSATSTTTGQLMVLSATVLMINMGFSFSREDGCPCQPLRPRRRQRPAGARVVLHGQI